MQNHSRLALALAATVAAAGLATAAPTVAAPGAPGVAAEPPKGVRFLKANQWPKVKGWGAWTGDSVPSNWTVLMCGVLQLPRPYAGTYYRAEKSPVQASGREWISAAANRKAAAALVSGFGAVLRDCAAGYGKYTPHPSSAAVVDRTPAGRKQPLKVFAVNYLSGYTDPPEPGYALWAIGQRGHRVVVTKLNADGPPSTAPVKGFIKTARTALDTAVK